MKNKLILLTSLFLLICFNSCKETPKTPNTYNFEYVYSLPDYNLPIIKLKVGDKDVNFVVDTGSEANIISSSYYKENEKLFKVVKDYEYVLSTMDTETKMKSNIVETIVEDSITVNFVTMEINPMLNNISNKQGITVKGILGIKFLYDNNVVIDFSNNKIITNSNKNYATV